MEWEVWIDGELVEFPPLTALRFGIDGPANYGSNDRFLWPRHTTLTWGSAADYINPVWLAECHPGGGPHPRLHRALFRRLAQRTTRRHQRRHR